MESQIAKNSLVETTIQIAEELLRKGFSAIFEKFNFAALGKSWAVAVCALQRRRRGGEEYRQNVEKKNMNLEPIVTAYVATKGMREVGQLSLLLLFWLFFFFCLFYFVSVQYC